MSTAAQALATTTARTIHHVHTTAEDARHAHTRWMRAEDQLANGTLWGDSPTRSRHLDDLRTAYERATHTAEDARYAATDLVNATMVSAIAPAILELVEHATTPDGWDAASRAYTLLTV